jgi:hypothetical protein
MLDGAAFLWRSELAGQPRDAAAWRAMYEYANRALPRPGSGLADLHVILSHCVMGDAAALDARARQMAELAREGRYPSGSYLPALSRGFTAFERGDFPAAIEVLGPLAGENERIGGSRAQRPDRVHVVEGLSQRRPAGGSPAFARRAATRCYRRSGHGDRRAAVIEGAAAVAKFSICPRTPYPQVVCRWNFSPCPTA